MTDRSTAPLQVSGNQDSAPGEQGTAEWGRLFVTRQCCGAGTCRNLAPELLGEVAPKHNLRDDGERPPAPAVLPGTYEEGAPTGVLRQPRNLADLKAARAAVASCPFNALRLERPAAQLPPGEPGPPWREFPRPLEENVWVVGRPSKENYGAMPYFIELPGGGVLVDVPQPTEELFRWLEERGGVRWLFLTHRDHVQHHAAFKARFPKLERVIGAADVNLRASQYAAATGDVEHKLGDGPGPMTLDGAPIPESQVADAELAVIPQPGHTPGSLCLLYRGRYLFTGDHFSWSKLLGRLQGHRLQCWEDWERQCASVRRLADWAKAGHLRFTWILPGHGEWHRFEGDGGAAVTAAALEHGLDWMRRQPPGHVSLLNWVPYVMSRTNPRGGFARFVRFIGGGDEAWLLPRDARRYVVDYDPARTDAGIRRAYVLGAGAVALFGSGVWLAARVAGALLSR